MLVRMRFGNRTAQLGRRDARMFSEPKRSGDTYRSQQRTIPKRLGADTDKGGRVRAYVIPGREHGRFVDTFRVCNRYARDFYRTSVVRGRCISYQQLNTVRVSAGRGNST